MDKLTKSLVETVNRIVNSGLHERYIGGEEMLNKMKSASTPSDNKNINLEKINTGRSQSDPSSRPIIDIGPNINPGNVKYDRSQLIDQKQGLDTNPELTPKHPEQKIKKPQIWDGSLPKPVPQPIIPSTPKQNFIYETLATRRREEQRREMTPEMKRTERAFQMDILKNADFTPFKEDNPNDQPGTVGNPRWEKNERLRKEGIAAANAEAQTKGVLTSELK